MTMTSCNGLVGHTSLSARADAASQTSRSNNSVGAGVPVGQAADRGAPPCRWPVGGTVMLVGTARVRCGTGPARSPGAHGGDTRPLRAPAAVAALSQTRGGPAGARRHGRGGPLRGPPVTVCHRCAVCRLSAPRRGVASSGRRSTAKPGAGPRAAALDGALGDAEQPGGVGHRIAVHIDRDHRGALSGRQPHQCLAHHDRGLDLAVRSAIGAAVIGRVRRWAGSALRRSRSRQALTTMRCSQLPTAASWRNDAGARCAASRRPAARRRRLRRSGCGRRASRYNWRWWRPNSSAKACRSPATWAPAGRRRCGAVTR